MPPAKFYDWTYAQLRPEFGLSADNENRMLFKGLGTLPRPRRIQSIQQSNNPLTAEMIGLDTLTSPDDPTGNGLCAVVVDSGIFKQQHLGERVLMRHSAQGNPGDVEDKYGHGTHMAGIIAADIRVAGMGIAPNAGLISIKVTRSISGEATWTSIAKALDITLKLSLNPGAPDLHGRRISVVNLSFNSLDCLDPSPARDSQKVFAKIAALREVNIPVVVSAGNLYEKVKGLTSGLGYPAGSAMTINVGAAMNFEFPGKNKESLATFSERKLSGMEISDPVKKIQHSSKNFLLAPGACSVSLSNDNISIYSVMSGTSSAAAVVTGCILLLQEAYIKKYGELPTVDVIKDLLVNGSKPAANVALPPAGHGPGTRTSKHTPVVTKFYDNKMYCGVNIANSLKLI